MRLPLLMQIPQNSLAVGHNIFLKFLKPLLKGLSGGFSPRHSEWGARVNNPYPRTTLRGESNGAGSRALSPTGTLLIVASLGGSPPSGPG